MTAPMVLIVEDEPKIARVLADYLRAAGFGARVLPDGAGLLDEVRRARPHLVLLDRMLPSGDGLELCAALRRESTVPVILLTARVEEGERLAGLDAGADDYICKPFSPREVVARVRAVLRRAAPTDGAPAADVSCRRVGPFDLDETCMRISVSGTRLDLTTSEYRLLRCLLLHPGRVYSRMQLLAELHGDGEEVYDRAIDTHIKNLRKKLQRTSASATLLRSVYGVGYRLELDVEPPP